MNSSILFIAFFAGLLLVASATDDREFEKFVEKHQHLIPAETKARLFREKRAGSNQ